MRKNSLAIRKWRKSNKGSRPLNNGQLQKVNSSRLVCQRNTKEQLEQDKYMT